MLHVFLKAEEAFQANLADWRLGGPRVGGWTRTGDPIDVPPVKLLGFSRQMIPVNDALTKNWEETEKWHISFLRDIGKAYNQTDYWKDYLFPRYGPKAPSQAELFISLFWDIKQRGVTRPVWLADMKRLGLGYFRFDGCHRVCAAKVAGFGEVPAIVFKTGRC